MIGQMKNQHRNPNQLLGRKLLQSRTQIGQKKKNRLNKNQNQLKKKMMAGLMKKFLNLRQKNRVSRNLDQAHHLRMTLKKRKDLKNLRTTRPGLTMTTPRKSQNQKQVSTLMMTT